MARIYKRQACGRNHLPKIGEQLSFSASMLIALRSPSAVFSMFRQHMLGAFIQWIEDSRPTRAEIDAEIAATVSAMRQISEVV